MAGLSVRYYSLVAGAELKILGREWEPLSVTCISQGPHFPLCLITCLIKPGLVNTIYLAILGFPGWGDLLPGHSTVGGRGCRYGLGELLHRTIKHGSSIAGDWGDYL